MKITSRSLGDNSHAEPRTGDDFSRRPRDSAARHLGEAQAGIGEAQESLRDAPGSPGKLQEQLRNEQREFQKICFFSIL